MVLLGLGGWIYYDKKVAGFAMENPGPEKIFSIQKGQGVKEIGEKLQQEGLVARGFDFVYYIWRNNLKADLKAGDYILNPGMTIREIADKIAQGQVEAQKEKIEKITIPEGFRNTKIVDLLKKERPALADEFQKLSDCRCLVEAACDCDQFSQEFPLLKEIPPGVDLEGYLFPDTYFLAKNETGKSLARKMLINFQSKTADLEEARKASGFSWHQVITLASVVEREANTENDKKLVASVFLNRIEQGMPLQSCATIAYAKNEDKIQFSYEDTRLESPYNTYLNPGLPPGPIANPGLEAIRAVLFPQESDYFYFLNNLQTGEMVFSKTGEEHSQNKRLNGLE